MAAAHFFYHAGWADKLEYVAPGRRPASARRRRPGDPLELPAAHAGLEARPGAGDGQLRRLKPAETTSITALKLAEILQQAPSCRRASSTSSPGAGRRAGVMGTPGSAKVAFTGSTEVGKAIMRQLAGTTRR
jgi:aldehyde dehydrogenase (NAD+)